MAISTITPVYAALLALLFVVLSFRTIRFRRKFSVAIGTGDQSLLTKASRAHGNFAEYVPLSLLLIYFIEVGAAIPTLTHTLCSLLLAGRLIHAWGISQEKENLRFRVTGMVMTFATIVIAALSLFAIAILR